MASNLEHPELAPPFDPLDGPGTIPAQLAAAAATFGSRDFLVGEDGRRLSFAEAESAARAMARAFMAAGVSLGDRVAIWAPNSVEWVIACLGLQLAGAVMIPLNTRYKGEEAAYILERSRATVLCTVSGFLGNDYPGMLAAARGGPADGRPVAGLPHLLRVVELNPRPLQDFLATGATVSEAELDTRIARITPDSLCDILFTSGTTGLPKGAMFNHRQALGGVRSWNYSSRFRPGDRMVIVSPFFHSFGYRAGWVSCLVGGMTGYPVATLDSRALAELIVREAITLLPGPPAIFQALFEEPAARAITTLRVGNTGAANIPVSLLRDAREKLGIELVLTAYGLTESTAFTTVTSPEDDDETIAETVGRPYPGLVMKLVDADGRTVPDGEAGEICVKGFLVMQGYFEDPAATAEAIDADGWLHTGDVGVIGPNGSLRIVDRLKDIVIVGGFNVYPAEVENLLATAPGVAEATVVGMPDHRLGEVAVAFVVPAPGAKLDEAELTAWSREHMANFKVPRRFITVDALPRTPLGKVRRTELRDQAAALAI